ncbi:MAG: ATP-binding protein [Symploca sp. SIO2G7]|nr:ATP-binding protein [Symploca sp. SIO2G7]
MARGELLRKLFRSFSHNEREAFYAAATELIEEEKRKSHTLLARDLEKILHNGNGNGKSLASNGTLQKYYPDVPCDRETGFPLVRIQHYDLTWNAVILSQTNLAILEETVLENRKRDTLTAYGLEPKSKLLFCGPPGCGKTLTAQVLAGVLGLPLLYVDLTAVFSSLLGETATNLKRIFDFIEKTEWVVLFDEFDAIARERSTANEHGEVKRLVNSLLQLIDLSKSESLFIAATNHESLLDEAIWRRFDEILFFEKPPLDQRFALLKRYLTSIRHGNVNLKKIAQELDGATGADIERVCSDVIKNTLLKDDKALSSDTLKSVIARYQGRMRIIADSERRRETQDCERV